VEVAVLPTKGDQVTGFGSSAKRPVVRALKGSYVKDLLESLRVKAEKP